MVDHPTKVWLIGPLFASITGVAFKEAVCYGKAEALALAVLTPALLLSHLSHVFGEASPVVETGLLGLWAASFLLFALGKWSQPVHEDIGDKSVFTFMALSEEEQQRTLAERKSID